MGGYLAAGRVHTGDVLALAGQLEPQSVQTIVTSPPYWNLRSYLADDHPDKPKELGNEATPGEFVANLVAVFAALRPALKDSGTLWCNLGDCFTTGASTAPRKSDPKAVADLSAGMRRVGSPEGLGPKQLVGIPWRVAFALQADGWILRSDVVWAKPNAMPESVRDRPTRSHEYLFLLSKSARYSYDGNAIKEPFAEGTAGRIGQPSLDTQQGGYKTEAYQQDHPGKKGRDRRPADILRAMRDNGQPGRNKRDVWTVPTTPYPSAHFATFPPDLIRPCILASSRMGDMVLDPFLGSGTTAMVAVEEGRRWVGFDVDERAVRWTAERLAKLPVGRLFA